MGNNTPKTKETSRCVDWMSNVPIRACSRKPAGRRFCRGMEASTSKRHACPGHQGYCDHLKCNRYRLKRKKAANRIQTNQSGDHDQEPKNGYHFQQPDAPPLDSVCLRATFYPRHDPSSTLAEMVAVTQKPGDEPSFSAVRRPASSLILRRSEPSARIAPIVKELLAAGVIIRLDTDHEDGPFYAPAGYVDTNKIRATIYFSSGLKVKVKTLFILTGAPLKIAGLKTHLRAASTAALRSARWPLIALASTTSPSSEMVTSTSTVPVAFIFLAFGG